VRHCKRSTSFILITTSSSNTICPGKPLNEKALWPKAEVREAPARKQIKVYEIDGRSFPSIAMRFDGSQPLLPWQSKRV
jgi:hypothetical protein